MRWKIIISSYFNKKERKLLVMLVQTMLMMPSVIINERYCCIDVIIKIDIKLNVFVINMWLWVFYSHVLNIFV